MYGILGLHQSRARARSVRDRRDLEAVTTQFLLQTRRSALGHFTDARPNPRLCHTLQHVVPLQAASAGCNGTIVAHISAPMFQAWEDASEGSPSERNAHVAEQIQLMLSDLSDHDIHGYLALTEAQCKVYGQDLEQLVTESLNRTTFCTLRRPAKIHWEGTLVRSLQPPILVLVVSIGF